ncbi:uncharacterized protein LOC144136618 [Amblyomma americanum]
MKAVALLLLLLSAEQLLSCSAPGLPRNGVFPERDKMPRDFAAGTTVTYACSEGFQLLGSSRRTCLDDGGWHPRGLPFCLVDVSASKTAHSSQPRDDPKLALDGNRTTCSSTLSHLSPWFLVDLRRAFPISVVKLDLPHLVSATPMLIRVGNSSTSFENSVCSVFEAELVRGHSLFLPCTSPESGRYLSVHLGGFGSLTVCEIAAYSEFADTEEGSPETTTVLRHDAANEPPANRSGLLGMRGLTGVSIGAFVLLAPICCCCWCQRCTKCCCKKSSGNQELRGADNAVFVLSERDIGLGYASSWKDLESDGTVPTGASGVTARLRDVSFETPTRSFYDVDLNSP